MAPTDLPIMAFSTGSTTLPRVGHRRLRGDLSSILGEVHAKHGAVEVVNDGRREAVVVDHEVFASLVADSRDGAALRDSLPLLLGAAAAGVALPSETMRRLGVALPDDVEALKRFRSTVSVPITHDENGDPLAHVRPIRLLAVVEADEEELVLLDIDD